MIKNLTIYTLIISALFSYKSFSQDQQPYILKGTEVRDVKSKITGQEYQLLIQLPYSYQKNPDKKYPVVYFCDGFYDFPLFTAIYGSGVYDKTIPECFLVGFSYKGANPDFESLRTYDYTHTVKGSPDSSGGAPRFLEVVEKEFIPFMQNNYRVDTNFRVLGGSSKGGLFTLFTLFTKPYLFDGYMAISPAADWDNGSLFKTEEQFHNHVKTLPVTLFMSMAEHDLPDLPYFMKSIVKMDSVLQKHNYSNFRYHYQFIPGAYHSGTKPEAYTRAMMYIFEPVLSKYN